MSANTDPGASARPARDEDESTDDQPPDHGVPTHSRARFLWECHPSTPLDELGELYDRWNDSSEQVDLGRWSE